VWATVKKIFCICIFIFIFSAITFAQKIPKNHIGIFDDKYKLIDTIPIDEFKTLITAAKLYNEELKAENNKQIKIVVKEKQSTIKLGETYKADVIVTWYNEKNEIIKTLVLEVSIDTKKENFGILRILYRDISEVGFPILFTILIIIIAL